MMILPKLSILVTLIRKEILRVRFFSTVGKELLCYNINKWVNTKTRKKPAEICFTTLVLFDLQDIRPKKKFLVILNLIYLEIKYFWKPLSTTFSHWSHWTGQFCNLYVTISWTWKKELHLSLLLENGFWSCILDWTQGGLKLYFSFVNTIWNT